MEILLPKEINPNNYLPFDIPGLEILIAYFYNIDWLAYPYLFWEKNFLNYLIIF